MKISKIHIENYKTYRALDLSLEVTPDRPIILIGGANGCGKTTLFDAIYHALYGLTIRNKPEFMELFNAGVRMSDGIENKRIILEITFSGIVMGRETSFRLQRSYILFDNQVRERVALDMDGTTYSYGSHTKPSERKESEEVINKIIAANLPKELSQYFLFDAMKTGELVKEEQINSLIMNNINSVMGFNKYDQMQRVAKQLLDDRTAEQLSNEQQRQAYQKLLSDKKQAEENLQTTIKRYQIAIEFDTENKDRYKALCEGRNADEITKDKIKQIEDTFHRYTKDELDYRNRADDLVKSMEEQVIYPRIAHILRAEIESIIASKQRLGNQQQEVSPAHIENIVRDILQLLREEYQFNTSIQIDQLVQKLLDKRLQQTTLYDEYAYLNSVDVKVLGELIHAAYNNPFIILDKERERLNNDLIEMPKRRETLQDYQKTLGSSDYTLIARYEDNQRIISQLQANIRQIKEQIAQQEQDLKKYDFDVPQIPDPKLELLKRLPSFFDNLGTRLLRQKKADIERKMKDLLNLNLVVYAGVIGRVELGETDSKQITFKIFHRAGNEIYLSQLNAGAKQTVMQVLLKVLYDLGDYEPPVMIDTVMGVLDKESRETILEHYFPGLAKQTILLSTDTEITTEQDFEKLQAFVAHTYTLKRDKEAQCTTIVENYFGLPLTH